MATVADQIAQVLVAAGVDRMYGIPGGGSSVELICAAQAAGIEFVLTQHETTAVMMAGLYGATKGTVGVAVSALGPGVANTVNGMAHAYMDRLPVILFSDRYADGLNDVALRQQIDHQAMMRPITKASLTLHNDSAVSVLRRAIRTALTGRPGPIFIDFPNNEAGKECVLQSVAPASLRPAPQPIVPDSILQQASAQMARAEYPVILAGLSALRDLPNGSLARLASTLRAPVFTSGKAKGVIAEDEAWSAGVFMGGKLEMELLNRADLLIFVGYDPVELLKRTWSAACPTVIVDSTANTDQMITGDLELVGDLSQAIDRLTAEVGASRSRWESDQVQLYRANLIKLLDLPLAGLSPNHVVQVAREVAPRNTVLTADVGASKLLLILLWEAYAKGDFHMSNGLATMGFSVPAALAAKLAEPERPVVCLTGDAGFMMRVQELLTARRHKLAVVWTIFADNQHSLINVKQQKKGLSPYGIDFPRVGYQELATAFGLRSFQVHTADEYRQALREALDAPNGAIIEARIDPSGYSEQFDLIREL